MSAASLLLFTFLALASLALDLVLLRQAAARARRAESRRAAMRRARMITYYPGSLGTGMDGDPYLRPWERALERMRDGL